MTARTKGAPDTGGPTLRVRAPSDPPRRAFVGVGIDLASVPEVRDSLRDFGDRYLHRVFTATEIADCAVSLDPAPHLAARFAAKEATIKALRVEGAQPPWTSIEVRRHRSGCCEMHLTGTATRLAAHRGIDRLDVSLSHEGDFAVAVVVATTEG